MASQAVIDGFERKIVRNCSPTLMGIKPANLFACCERTCHSGSSDETYRKAYGNRSSLTRKALDACRSKLSSLGVEIEVLAELRGGPLVYVFRPRMLVECLCEPRSQAFLDSLGYPTGSLSGCIESLSTKLDGSIGGGSCEFPHEIGLFLGYPYEDVIGFIENGGANYRFIGCWKVYSDIDGARKRFASYKECTKACEWLYEMGVGIECMAADCPVGRDAPSVKRRLDELREAV